MRIPAPAERYGVSTFTGRGALGRVASLLGVFLLTIGAMEGAVVPILHVQTAGTTASGGTSVTVSLKPTVAGDLVVVGASTSGGSVQSVTDNQGDAFTLATARTISGEGFAIYYSKTVPANVTAVTLKFPYGNSDVVVSEYSGLNATAPLDQVVSFDNGYNSGTAFTSGTTGTTSQAAELAWSLASNCYSANSTWTPGTGWTSRLSVGSSFVQDQILGAVGAYASTGVAAESSSDYEVAALLVTFKGLSGTPPPDTIPPTVSMTAPNGGSTVSKSITLSANASDNVAVASVQFLVDGVSVGTVTTSPYSLTWNSVSVSDGVHTLTAIAKDTSNNSAVSAGVTITVNNSFPSITSFTASPSYIALKGSSTLSWVVSSNATVQISGIGTVTGNSIVVTPAQTTTYTLTATNASGSTTAQTTINVNTGVNIILDSDIAVNVDDVGDHAMLWALSKTGEANVIALITSSSNTWSAPAVYAIANYYKHPGVMIGAYQGNSPNSYSSTNSYYTQQLASQFGKPNDTRANYQDSTTVYRKALAAVADNSVYIVAGGFYEPLRSLLQSPPDSISPLTGVQLVKKKVIALVPASGWNPDSGSSASFNFVNTPDAASYVFANWPGTVVTFGTDVGGDVLTGPSSSADPATNPIKDAYNLYCSNGRWCPNQQYAWTQVALLYAVRGGIGSVFSLEGQNGTYVVWGSNMPIPGRDLWTQSPAGFVSYTRKIVPAATLAATINQLIQAAP